jgi:hypothetical protein
VSFFGTAQIRVYSHGGIAPGALLLDYFRRYNSSMRKLELVAAFLLAVIAAVFFASPRLHSTITCKAKQVSVSSEVVAAAKAEQVADLSEAQVLSKLTDELAQAKPGITVAEWQRSHPSEKWHKPAFISDPDNSDREANIGDFCAVFVQTTPLPAGTELKRRAQFYLPKPPLPAVLPKGGAPSDLIETGCTLGIITATLTAENDDKLASTTRDVQAAFSSRFGKPSQEPDDLGIAGVSYKEAASVWRVGEARIVIKREFHSAYGSPDEGLPRLTIFSYLPNYQYEKKDHPDDAYEPPETYNAVIFQLAMRTAAQNSNISQPISVLYRAGLAYRERRQKTEQPGTLPQSLEPAEVARVLNPWLQASKDLSPQRRAAALLAAHLVLEISWQDFDGWTFDRYGKRQIDENNQQQLETDGVKQFEAVGAKFSRGAPDGTVILAKWVGEARELDPDGPIGDAVLLMTLSGWHLGELAPAEYTGKNADHIPDYIIEAGKKYLSRRRAPDVTARVEYFIASAYLTRVAVSQGETPDYDGRPVTQEETDLGRAAKPLALKYYRSMLAIDGTSKRAIAAWRSGWRLLADLPVHIQYTLFDD